MSIPVIEMFVLAMAPALVVVTLSQAVHVRMISEQWLHFVLMHVDLSRNAISEMINAWINRRIAGVMERVEVSELPSLPLMIHSTP